MIKILNKEGFCSNCGHDEARRGYATENGTTLGRECTGWEEVRASGFQAKFCTKCGTRIIGIAHCYEGGKEFAAGDGGLWDRVG